MACSVGQITPLMRVFMILYLKYYVHERMIKYSIRNNASGGKKCEECFDLALFNANYHIDANDPQISNHIVKWKRYEYVGYTPVIDSTSTSRKINLVEIDISLIDFMNFFRDQIYKYIKHSHSARWQDLQFKKS